MRTTAEELASRPALKKPFIAPSSDEVAAEIILRDKMINDYCEFVSKHLR